MQPEDERCGLATRLLGKVLEIEKFLEERSLNFMSRLNLQLARNQLLAHTAKRYQRFIRFGLLLILPLFLVVACSQNNVRNVADISNGDSCQRVLHDLGETKICGQPQKVVAIGPHMLDILLSLGVQPVGYAEIEPFKSAVFDNPVKQIPYLGDRVKSKPINIGRRGEPSLETLVKVKPDLILGENFGQEYYAEISQVAPTLLFRGSLKDQWQKSIETIAQALGRQQQANQAIARYNQQLTATRKQLANVVAANPRLLLLASNDLKEYIDVRTGADYTGGILQELGFQLVTPPNLDKEAELKQISLEVLPTLNADSIIVLVWSANFPYDLDKVKQEWNQNQLARDLPASRNGRVYFVDYHLWSNIRGAIAAEAILKQAQMLMDNS